MIKRVLKIIMFLFLSFLITFLIYFVLWFFTTDEKEIPLLCDESTDCLCLGYLKEKYIYTYCYGLKIEFLYE